MKIVQINSVPNLSTGSVMMRNHERYMAEGHESWVMWGRGRKANKPNEFYYGSKLGFYLDVLKTRLFGHPGFHSKYATKKLLWKLDFINPDLVHLHNLHGYHINIKLLFNWLKEHNCKVEWTLHDCWAFTGHCAHFIYVKCEQWKQQCSKEYKCPQARRYPKIIFESVAQNSVVQDFERKKALFTILPHERLKLITPSKWLANLVKESFLSKYEVEVHYNTIDKTIFKPTPSDFREKYGLQNKFIILGVASTWTNRKGLCDFIKLANDLNESYTIVLVGLIKKQINRLPNNIIGLEKTKTSEELAEIYSAADIFFNPTKEDNFPTVNLEAEACGSPVITYDTGGCKETICNNNSHSVQKLSELYQYIVI